MRNFSTRVDLTNSFTVDTDIDFTDDYFVDLQHVLVTTMDANPSDLTSSQEEVLANFIGWIERAKEDDQNGLYPQEPVFFYANMNTGHNVVFVIVDSKSKAHLSYA